jgi:GT2 family glycosyltransferase
VVTRQRALAVPASRFSADGVGCHSVGNSVAGILSGGLAADGLAVAGNFIGEQPRWTVVTVTFNSAVALERFWSGVQIPDFVDWVVVDNNSSDESVYLAKSFGARVIALGSNKGFGGGNNVGFGQSQSEYVAFVNPDVRVDFEDLLVLENKLQNDPKALFAPQLVNEDGSLQPNGRGEPYLVYKVMHRLCPHKVEKLYRCFAEPGQMVDVRWLTGAVVVGTREHLRSLGPWDDRFFVYYEDSDLGLRNLASGGRNFVIGDSTWQHGWARETSGKFSFNAWRLEIASLVKFYLRYPRFLAVPFKKLLEAKHSGRQ